MCILPETAALAGPKIARFVQSFFRKKLHIIPWPGQTQTASSLIPNHKISSALLFLLLQELLFYNEIFFFYY
ncbi:Uncharacterized protein dnm_037790 [Desulfonema magnum]|uniref:Uncharacterized protein n=1 Tax=Desulfonema magnum TaxID=45655 RepID=A0A975BLF6_9BACT|nr:Uncharacterized protein dnm_037790 [Desulfonema magnum]